MSSSTPLQSPAPVDSPVATSQSLPPLQPLVVMDNPSPPPMPQIAPLASPPSLPPPAHVVVLLPPSMPPVPNPPPLPVTPVTSPSPITVPVSSPPVASPPPPEANANPVTPVPPTTLLPEPPSPSITSPPPLPMMPSLPQPPLPSPPLPTSPPSQPPSTSWPPPAPPPLAAPFPPKGTPPATATPSPITHPPTRPIYPPSPPSFSLTPPPPPPPTSMVSSPPSLPLAKGNLPLSSKQFHISTGLIVACAIGGVFILLMLALLCICCKVRRRNHSTKEHYNSSIILAPKDSSKNVRPHHSEMKSFQSGECVITVQIKTFRPPPLASNVHSRSTNSPGTVNALPRKAPRDGAFDLSNGTCTYEELVVATNGFSDSNLLGQGGFGYVHKGFLPCGKEIAVKQLKEGCKQGEREFQAEIEIISRVHHKHLVSLVGYCINGSARLLVYEFVPKNTLEFHLHGTGQPVMEWETRLKIAIGSAKGLAYLHEDCHPKIVHRDIKAANILLDDNFEAKVSDFGLARSFSDAGANSTHNSTRVVGTFGYMAPEYALSGKLTDKSDVYSYGVVLLELITGHPPITTAESTMNESLVDWARPLLAQALEDGSFEALVDPRLGTNYNNSEMASMVACAAACVHPSSWVRPRMSQIVRALEGGMSAQDLNAGIFRPRHSTLYGSSISSNSSTYQYEENMASFDVARGSRQDGISGCTGTTSEYGLNPSSSSSEASIR